MRAFEYREPTCLDQLVALRAEFGARAKLLAGGTDLLLQMEARKHTPAVVIAMNRVPELRGVTTTDGATIIGAMATLREVETSAVILRKFPFLAYSAGQIGSVQVRNLATLVGNLTNAAPSADAVPALYVARATVCILGARGERTVPVEAVMTGPGQTSLTDDELVVSLTLPDPPPGFAGVYLKHSIRMAMDLAFVGVAVSVVTTNGRLDDAQVALCAVAPTVIHAESAEAVLRGQPPTPEILEQAATAAAVEARPISDLRASAEYRRELVAALTRKALRQLTA